MKTGKRDNGAWLYGVLCWMTVITASFPIACNYIMSGGRVTEWVARVEELAAGFHSGKLYFFAQMGTLADTGIWINGVNSNFWLFLPGFLAWTTGDTVAAWRIGMLLIQTGTMTAAMLFFREVFAKKESRLSVFFGILLYMTCPCRIFVCYDLADFFQAVSWMLFPSYMWAVLRVFEGNGGWKQILFMGVALAGIGYANTIFFLTLFGMTLLVSVCLKKFKGILGLTAGVLFAFPGLYRLGIYVIGRGFPEFDVVLHSIMSKGYYPGQYFSSYFWRADHPGMGLGMFICFLAVLWMRFVKGEREGEKRCRIFTGMSVFFMILSSCYFPWDLVQRLGNWALKLVSLIDTPALFWGMAYLGFCVPAADGIDRVSRSNDKLAAFAVPLMVLLVCAGVCIYQCNMLTYTRPPVILGQMKF